MPRAPESFVVGRERGAAVLSSGNGRKQRWWLDGWCWPQCSHPGGPWPPAPVWVEGWAGGGLAPLFSACLFSAPTRMSVLLLVCLFQASVMWRFIHFQLRRWREYWNEQSSRKRAAAGAKQQAKPLKRDSGECPRAGVQWAGMVGASVLWFSIPSAGCCPCRRCCGGASCHSVLHVPSRIIPRWWFSPYLRASPKRVWPVQGTKCSLSIPRLP